MDLVVGPGSPGGIFGVPLHESIKYANVAISLTNDKGESYIYGYVPIVIAKCGVFLKEKGEAFHVHVIQYKQLTCFSHRECGYL